MFLNDPTLSDISKFLNFTNPKFIKKPIMLLRILKSVGVFKSINKVSYGSENLEIMQMLGFGLSHNKIKKL